MILEIDAGNSRIKWRALDSANEPIAMGVVPDEQALFAELEKLTSPTMVRMSSVRGPEATDAICQWAEQQWKLPVHVASVTRNCAGVTNHYQDMGRLGVDRWLAMLAAFNRARGACVIVDAGTALTIDAVSAEGSHLGGYILPGRQLMAKVLQENTRIRLAPEPPEAAVDLGHGTEAAVRNGIYASEIALIEKVVRDCHAQLGELAIYLAGGDAPVLSELLGDLETEIVSDLVLDGLVLACPGKSG